ncbi:MAG: DUF4377 domain-containing protein [Bacteroidales bacterium]
MKNQILVLMFIGIMLSCTGSKNSGNNSTDKCTNNCKNVKSDYSQTVDMRINHYYDTGVGMGPMLVMLVQQDDEIGTDKWSKFFSKIEGFNYEQGHIYDITAKIEKLENPPADASSLKYILKEVKSVKKAEPGETFDISLKINNLSFVKGAPEYKLVGLIDIDCNNLCKELGEGLKGDGELTGTFIHLEDNKIQLTGLK